ncbi:glucose dehydrogenase [FAD, quinone]-like [Neocloeon triangulifer]|uniref:glucose dehydrogenase [FAD, quinone]-like n=1 Tax=Neocloeon triangulifer TaxID=2078957 RepID=UPI00286EC67A|nr:glucose dehydrogenase [FAD, quinone]-like [Neocloeon triangulifer]
MELFEENNSLAGGSCQSGTLLLFSLLRSLVWEQCYLGRQAASVPNRPESYMQTYDFVVVGGGSAGCVLASRLTEVAKWNVLLIEAGGDEPPKSQVPGFIDALMDSEIDWSLRSVPQETCCLGYPEQRCRHPRGRVLGGSSTINRMKYVRGNRRDYDRWVELGNPGWSYAEVLPFFKKSERNYEFFDEYHSSEGYLPVERFRHTSALSAAIIRAGAELGYRTDVDVNGRHQDGFVRAQTTSWNGIRYNSAKSFLKAVRNRTNLHVVKHALVTRVLFEGADKRASGVEFIFQGTFLKVFATKEVILSAGAFKSPQILLLSGIGPAEHLREKGVFVNQDLPGVGENLQDHVSVPVPIVTRGSEREDEAEIESQYLLKRSGPLMTTGISQNTAFISSSPSEGKRFIPWPDVQLYFGQSPRMCSTTKGANSVDCQFFPLAREFNIFPAILRPKSRGVVSLADKDPTNPPLINPRYFSKREDVRTLVSAVRRVQKLLQTEAFRRIEARLNATHVRGCENHPFDSDPYWECAMRANSVTVHHVAGTCKMGPENDPEAVVDAELRVHGVQGLRVIDASIMPHVVSGNTNAPTIMIAEKGADFIKKQWNQNH